MPELKAIVEHSDSINAQKFTKLEKECSIIKADNVNTMLLWGNLQEGEISRRLFYK